MLGGGRPELGMGDGKSIGCLEGFKLIGAPVV